MALSSPRPSRRISSARARVAVALACWAIPIGVLASSPDEGNLRGGWFDRELRRFRTYPHLDRAHRLIDAGRLDEARAELEEGLRVDSGNRATRSAYVILLHRLGDHEGVVEQAGLLLRDDPDSSTAWLYRGLAHQGLGEPAAALEDLQTASALSDLSATERHVALAALADLALRLGRSEQALGFLEQLPRSRWTFGEHVVRGSALERLGRLPEAASAYREAAGTASERQERLFARREEMAVLDALGDVAGARKAARAALDLAPGDAGLLVTLGGYSSRLGEDAEAVRWWRAALASSGLSSPQERAEVLLSLGYAYLRRGQTAQAEKAFLDSAGLGSAFRSRALVEAAEVVLKEGDSGRALRHLEEATAATSGTRAQVRLYERQAYLLQSLGRFGEAATAFESALALEPRRPDLLRGLGHLLMSSGRAADSVAPFERSLELEDDPEVWDALGLAQAASGQAENALASYRRALEGVAHPEERQERILMQMAELEAERHRNPQAGDLFIEAFAQRRSPAALVGAAESYARAGLWREAASVNESLVQLEELPSSARAEAWQRLAYARAGTGELQAAAEAFTNAIATGMDDGRTHRELGILLQRQGRCDEAIPHFTRAQELRPAPLNLVYLGHCENARGKPGLAIRHLQEAIASGEDLDAETRRSVLGALGFLCARIHDYERAARNFEASLGLRPDPLIGAHLGRMQRLLGHHEEARRTLEGVALGALPPNEAAVVLDELAELSETEQDLAAASEAWSRARTLTPSAERDYRLALLEQERGHLPDAIALLESAVAGAPDQSRYRVALAYASERAGRPAEAARLFEDVVAREPHYPGLYQELAYNRMRAARNEEAARWFQRAIDDVSFSPAPAGERTEQTRMAYRLRREVSTLENHWDATAYLGFASQALLGVSEGFGGALATSQGGVELAFRPPGIGLRENRVFHVFGRLLGANLAGASDPHAYQAGLGLRYKPLGGHNLYLWVERLLGLSEEVPDSWLLRGLFSWDRGHELRPAQPRWPYSYFFADVARFSGGAGTLIYGEARQGMSWKLADRILLTPHLVVEGRHRATDQADSTLAAGAGASVRLLFDDDRYHAYRSSVELRAYYKLGRSWSAGEAKDQSGFQLVLSVGL